MKVKICGLRTLDDVAIVNEAMPDYAGFIFAPGRRRTVTRERAAEMKRALDKRIKAVGVFVDAPLEEPYGLLKDGIIDIAQLHGNEDPRYVHNLKIISGATLIQAFVVKTADDLKKAYYSHADIVLLDAGKGDGKTFDWELTKGFTEPFLLAGGLSPDNVAEAIARCRPWGVDVSSGVETDGTKDVRKVLAFVKACRESAIHNS